MRVLPEATATELSALAGEVSTPQFVTLVTRLSLSSLVEEKPILCIKLRVLQRAKASKQLETRR